MCFNVPSRGGGLAATPSLSAVVSCLFMGLLCFCEWANSLIWFGVCLRVFLGCTLSEGVAAKPPPRKGWPFFVLLGGILRLHENITLMLVRCFFAFLDTSPTLCKLQYRNNNSFASSMLHKVPFRSPAKSAAEEKGQSSGRFTNWALTGLLWI